MFEKMKKAWKAGEGPLPSIPGTEAELAPIEAVMAHSATPEGIAEDLLEDKKEAIEGIKSGLKDYEGIVTERILSGVTDKTEQDQIQAEKKLIDEIWDRLSALEIKIGLEKQGTVR